MCFAPNIPDQPAPQQASKAPVLRTGQNPQRSRGRSGTILTKSSGEQPSQPTAKKTLLGA